MAIWFSHLIMEDQMKHKLMLGFMLSSLLSANSFALEIHGGKLISHKEWTKGNVIKSSVKEIASSTALKIPSHQFQQNESVNWISANSTTYKTAEDSVPVNTDTNFSGNTDVNISNGDSVQKTYTITSYLEVIPYCISMFCPITEKMVQDTVTLDPEGYVRLDRNIDMTTSINTVGYATYKTGVDIDDNVTNTQFSSSGNREYIQVTDTKK